MWTISPEGIELGNTGDLIFNWDKRVVELWNGMYAWEHVWNEGKKQEIAYLWG